MLDHQAYCVVFVPVCYLLFPFAFCNLKSSMRLLKAHRIRAVVHHVQQAMQKKLQSQAMYPVTCKSGHKLPAAVLRSPDHVSAADITANAYQPGCTQPGCERA